MKYKAKATIEDTERGNRKAESHDIVIRMKDNRLEMAYFNGPEVHLDSGVHIRFKHDGKLIEFLSGAKLPKKDRKRKERDRTKSKRRNRRNRVSLSKRDGLDSIQVPS